MLVSTSAQRTLLKWWAHVWTFLWCQGHRTFTVPGACTLHSARGTGLFRCQGHKLIIVPHLQCWILSGQASLIFLPQPHSPSELGHYNSNHLTIMVEVWLPHSYIVFLVIFNVHLSCQVSRCIVILLEHACCNNLVDLTEWKSTYHCKTLPTCQPHPLQPLLLEIKFHLMTLIVKIITLLLNLVETRCNFVVYDQKA